MSGGLGDVIMQLLMQQMQREQMDPAMQAAIYGGKASPAMPNADSGMWINNMPEDFKGSAEYQDFMDPNQSMRNMMARSQRTTDNRDPMSNSFRAPGGRGPTQEAAQRGRMRGR